MEPSNIKIGQNLKFILIFHSKGTVAIEAFANGGRQIRLTNPGGKYFHQKTEAKSLT